MSQNAERSPTPTYRKSSTRTRQATTASAGAAHEAGREWPKACEAWLAAHWIASLILREAVHGHILVTMVKTISAGEFKANCLKLMDQVQAQRTELVITKRGKAVARLMPVEEEAPSVFGCMVGTAEINGDLVEPLVAVSDWESNR